MKIKKMKKIMKVKKLIKLKNLIYLELSKEKERNQMLKKKI